MVQTLSDIQFPVYLIGKDKPENHDNVIFYHRQYKDREDILIIDDKNIQKPTVSLRRLQLLVDGAKLAKITHTIFFISDLIKLSSRSTWFLDSNGMLFTYTKSGNAKLLVRAINKVIPTTGGYILELEGIQTRFKCLYEPKLEKFAGVLKLGHMYILYGVYENPPEETWRKI